MDDIWVNLNDLYQIIRRMRKDDIATVHLSINDPEEDEGEVIPASLSVSGIKSADPDTELEYAEPDDLPAIEGLKPSVCYPVDLLEDSE